MTASSVNYSAERVFREHLRHSMLELKRDRDAKTDILDLLAKSSPQPMTDLQQGTGLNLLEFADVVRELLEENKIGLQGNQIALVDPAAPEEAAAEAAEVPVPIG